MSNLVLNFDVDLKSACESVYVAPFVSSGGTLENVTMTGEIRVSRATTLTACNILGFALEDNSVSNVYSNVRFLLNGTEYENTQIFWSGNSSNIKNNGTSLYLDSLKKTQIIVPDEHGNDHTYNILVTQE